MKTVLLLRHGATEGNIKKRYIGRTDEEMNAVGIAQAESLAGILPSCDLVFSSPMLRCLQTAKILFPANEITVIEDLRECDFGIFEGKTADELAENSDYRVWVDSYCSSPVPGGDSITDFKARAAAAFVSALEDSPSSVMSAFVTHGGCIMAILEQLAYPRKGFYDYHLENCGYYLCEWEEGRLTIKGEQRRKKS